MALQKNQPDPNQKMGKRQKNQFQREKFQQSLKKEVWNMSHTLQYI